MFAWETNKRHYIAISLVFIVLTTNLLLYRSPIDLPTESKWVVFGSLFDLAIFVPLILLAIYKKKSDSIKRFIIFMAAGLVIARFLISENHLEPFIVLTYVGFAIEGFILLFEFTILLILLRYLPKIYKQVRMCEDSLLHSFPKAVEGNVRKNPLVQVVVSEMLMFYYALGSWRQKAPNGKEYFTLHKNTSFIAFRVMIIHAIILETISLHWWLHNQSMVLSIVLLILNIYSILFFIGDIQSLRLNPIKITDQHLYLSMGLMKKMKIPLENISAINIDAQLLEKKIK
ncbi:beta-carotene 15,15'-monooxygenase [Bacillus carboniphilus]|uniref:Beta-carotene 15,15'-monooxygenase n=1 Tax=Bacillus carboniphilus TaxID=86663 RepID=A0ABY9JVW0_9BACI|nr:beta-carotene 15,15'-monooxygenase [Bacillus carboniphilus]WLR42408.1 beta-carotene 15,15'-monooxygenase [Bacillus carboniphilus]